MIKMGLAFFSDPFDRDGIRSDGQVCEICKAPIRTKPFMVRVEYNGPISVTFEHVDCWEAGTTPWTPVRPAA